MNNFIKPGDVMTWTAPSGGVVSGTGYKIGQCFCVATGTVAEGKPFEGMCCGVVSLPKATGAAWTEGALVYWDDTAKNVTTTSTGNLRLGVAGKAAASGDTTGTVRLSGTPGPNGA